MEGLIGFLFDNLFLVIIVLGILSTLFGRSGRKGGGRMPDFGGGPGGWPAPGQGLPRGMRRPGELRRPDAARGPEAAPRPEAAPHRSDRPEFVGREAAFPREPMPRRQPDAYGQEMMPAPRPVRMHEVLPATSPAASDAAASSPADLRSSPPLGAPSSNDSRVAPALQVERLSGSPIAGQDELRKAVLWAEILGPPRALKPRGRRRIGR